MFGFPSCFAAEGEFFMRRKFCKKKTKPVHPENRKHLRNFLYPISALAKRTGNGDMPLYFFASSALTSTRMTADLSRRILVASRVVSMTMVSSLMETILPMMPPVVVISSPT